MKECYLYFFLITDSPFVFLMGEGLFFSNSFKQDFFSRKVNAFNFVFVFVTI